MKYILVATSTVLSTPIRVIAVTEGVGYRFVLHLIESVVRKAYRSLTEVDNSYGWNQE